MSNQKSYRMLRWQARIAVMSLVIMLLSGLYVCHLGSSNTPEPPLWLFMVGGISGLMAGLNVPALSRFTRLAQKKYKPMKS